ncbi:MAG: hypothetical protein LBT96_01215, partial [Campylobacteraceae bacterium]|nr:hypothetical protein [Campylobacteraceae bacterium]
LFSQSIYPLPFTFDDSGLFVRTIDIHNFNKPKIGKGQIIEVALMDSDENIYYLNDKYPNTPGCTNIKTLDEFYSYNNKSDVMPCASLFFNMQNMQKISMNNNITILMNDGVNDIGKYTSYDAVAIIFHKNQLLGSMSYISPFHDKKRFLSLLTTINVNINIKNNIDEYLLLSEKYADRYMINTALKYAVSVLLLEPNNKKLKLLFKKIYAKQRELIDVNEKDLENLE